MGCHMVNIETKGKVMLISPAAEIDQYSAERMRSVIDASFEKSSCTYILFDFSRVEFMDSSGIGLLIGRYKQAEKRGGGLMLSNLNETMARLYTISGLAKIVSQFDNVDDALASVGGLS